MAQHKLSRAPRSSPELCGVRLRAPASSRELRGTPGSSGDLRRAPGSFGELRGAPESSREL
eukprot:8457908-Alexandrium_andersonii.AAC.1